ncbi:MAG: GNAT family N-acetyltransferase [Bacteroidales bacterium]|jgi:hypothetical protein|nr:GNAT family N-acetyltransferase [Bacteroidales bacterium]
MKFNIEVAGKKHCIYAEEICKEMEESAKVRGTGIAKRTSEYVEKKMCEGKAVIALDEQQHFAGFSYIESWSHDHFVANSGLIVNPQYRKSGLARQIKKKIFELSRKKFPNANIFSITTSLAVMKLNSEIGYKPVTFSELTDDEVFWKGCEACVNYDILQRNNRRMCLCTGMLYDPAKEEKFNFIKKFNVLERFRRVTTVKQNGKK